MPNNKQKTEKGVGTAGRNNLARTKKRVRATEKQSVWVGVEKRGTGVVGWWVMRNPSQLMQWRHWKEWASI